MSLIPLMHSIPPSNIADLIEMEITEARWHMGCASRAFANARRVRPECQGNPWFDAAVEHAERAAHHHACAIGWASR